MRYTRGKYNSDSTNNLTEYVAAYVILVWLVCNYLEK